MMLGLGLGAVMTAQAIAARALWPAPPAPRRPTKGLKPLRAEEENELVMENKELRKQLKEMTRDRDRLDQNEVAAIEKREEYKTERDVLKVRCDDLLRECKRLRKAAIRSEVDDDKRD